MWAVPAAAAVSLTVRVVRGGFDLDFGAVSLDRPARTEEVELTCTNSGTGQYRVYQELSGPLTNERGDRLPEQAMLMQISGGITGTPRTTGVMPVGERLQELFVADPQGTSETLRIAYAIAQGIPMASGTYRGVLRYTAESLESGAVVTERLNVRVQVEPSFGLEREMASPSRLSFGQIEPGTRSGIQELALRIVNNSTGPIELTQDVVEPFTSNRGDRLPAEALRASALSTAGASVEQPATEHPQSVLSDPRGETRAMRLGYAVAAPDGQPAGNYRGTLRLRLTGFGTSPPVELLVPIELDVKDVFDISVRSLDDAGRTLRFSRTEAGREPHEQRMLVDIRTNLGRPYQVLFGLDHPLVLASGEALPPDALRLSVVHSGPGRISHGTNELVSASYQPLYESDASGSSDSFIMVFRLGIPPDAPAGDYSARLRFSVTQF